MPYIHPLTLHLTLHKRWRKVKFGGYIAIPSHDTIGRVMAIVSPDFLQKFKSLWNKALNSDEGEKLKKIFVLGGKTQRSNANVNQYANHIVGVVDEDGFSMAKVCVDEKSNEITTTPELLDDLNIAGHK